MGSETTVSTDGERENFTDLVDRLLDTYRPEGVLIWLTGSNRNFGGYSPRQLMSDGDWAPLLDEADRLAGGAR